jgi:hypothetical protein
LLPICSSELTLNQVPPFLLLSGDGLYRSSGTGVGQLRPVLTGQKEKLREFRSHSTYLVINHRCKFSLFTPATPAGLIRRNLHNLFHCIYYNLACTKTIGGVRLPPPLPSNHRVAVFIIYLLNPISISSLEPILNITGVSGLQVRICCLGSDSPANLQMNSPDIHTDQTFLPS